MIALSPRLRDACRAVESHAAAPSRSVEPSIQTLASLARELARDAAVEPHSDAFRQLVITRLRKAWPDASARQITLAAIRIRLLLIEQAS